ncbi:MAG TPA: hypothetical protein VID27_21545, partial [Blastocatellia bacterium]
RKTVETVSDSASSRFTVMNHGVNEKAAQALPSPVSANPCRYKSETSFRIALIGGAMLYNTSLPAAIRTQAISGINQSWLTPAPVL